MAASTENRVILIDVRGTSQAIRDFRDLQRHARNVDQSVGRMGRTLNSLGNTVKAFIAYRLTANIAGMIPALIGAADAVALLRARLDLTNESALTTNEVFGDLFDVADRTRTSIDSVATLYTRLSAASKDLNVSQRDVAEFTELVSGSFLLSGATAGEAASGVTQISQAMSKGKLDGDEFKSMMENNVYFANILAKALGTTRGKLFELSEAGDITSKKLLTMNEHIQEVRASLGSMPATADQASTAWGNAFKKMFANSESLMSVIERIHGGAIILAERFGNLFVDEPIKDTTEAIKDQIEVVDELQKKLTRITGLNTTTGMPRSPSVLGDHLMGNAFEDFRKENEKLKVLRDELFYLQQAETVKNAGLEGPVQPPGDTKTAPSKDSVARTKAMDNWVKSIQKAEAELSLFNPKLERLDEMFFNEKISESIYNAELEKLTGNLSETGIKTQSFAEAQDQLNQVIASGRTELEVMIDQMNELSQVAADYPELAEKVAAAQTVIAEKFKETTEEDLTKPMVDWGNTATAAVKGLSASFVDMALSGKNSFEDFAKSFVINITKMIVQQSILNALSATSFGSSVLSGSIFGSAQGNVFQGGQITPFATGGVIDSPILFPLSNGTGLAGEAGPEGILPLARTPSGDLGVKSTGGGQSQSVVVHMQIATPNVDSFRYSQTQIENEMALSISRAARRGT